MTLKEEQILYRSMAEGNDKVMEDFFNLWYDPTVRYVFHRGLGEMATDIVNEAFLDFWHKAPAPGAYENEFTPRAYFMGIVNNKIKNAWKEILKRLATTDPELLTAIPNTCPAAQPELNTEVAFEQAELRAAAEHAALSELDRQIFDLNVDHGLKPQAIAKKLNLDVDTVYSH